MWSLPSLRRYRTTIGVAGILLLLALVLTYPLPLHLATHAPGDGSDDPAIIWNLWWVRHALLDIGRNPFFTDFMFFPIGINLAFYTLTTLNALVTLPVQLLWGVVPANNAVVYLALTLAGLGMYLLALDVLPSSVQAGTRRRAALLAAAIYTFSGHKFLFLSVGQFNIASTHWLPFYILYLRRSLRPPYRHRDSWLAALFLLFNGWTEFTYASFALLFTAFYGLFRLVQRPRSHWSSLLRALLGTGLPFAAGMSPILAMMVPDLLREGDFTIAGLGFADVFSNDLLAFFVPGHLHPLWGSVVHRFHFAYLNFAYLGYVALTLALFGLWKWRHEAEPLFWAVAGFAFVILSLGPTIRLNGASYDLPLPFDLLLAVPFFKANRYPGRYSVMIALCLALLAAHGFSRLPATRRRLAPFLVLLFLVLLENLSIPLPLSDFRVPDVYRQIAATPGDFSVLEVPLAWRNGFRVTGPLHNAFMFAQFYQTTHEKHLLGGNTSRNPEFKFQYFTEAPVINSLLALETGHTLPPGTEAQDRKWAPEVLRFFRVRYLVVRKLNAHKQRITPEATIPYIERTLPVTRWFSDVQRVVYRIDPRNPSPNGSLAATDPLANLVFAEGWGPVAAPDQAARWATREDARLFLPIGPEAYTLTFILDLPAGGQDLTVSIAGRRMARRDVAAGRTTMTIAVPADARRRIPAEVWLHFGRRYVPPPMPEKQGTIGSTGVRAPLPILVESAGEEVGNLAHIFVAGRDVATGGRGFNLAVIEPQTGTVTAQATFDTHLDSTASHRLAHFVAAIPQGDIVAVAVADEGSRLLNAEAQAALHTLGLAQDLQGAAHFRWSYAALGVKGAPQGSALETASATRPVRVGVGPAIREPALVAGVEEIRWRKAGAH